MTGTDVVERALSMLNYTDTYGRQDSRQTTELLRRGVPMLNAILSDMATVKETTFIPLVALTDTVPLTEKEAVIATYGVAMMLAQSENDGDNNQLYATLYNQKRNALSRPGGRVRDILPHPFE